MLPSTENEWVWLIGAAIVVFAVFVFYRFNRRRLAAISESAPRHVHSFVNAAIFSLLAAIWKNIGELEFWVWASVAAVHFIQGTYLFLNRNKPVDNSPAIVRSRAVVGLLWAIALMAPFAWVFISTANGAVFERNVWAFSAGAAIGGAIGVIVELQNLTAPRTQDS